MRAKRADGGVEPRLCYLPSTPQSPRGDSSPAGEPFGILQPPSQSCPRLRGKLHEVPKGERFGDANCRELFPPQLRLRSAERWLEYGRLAARLLHMCQDMRVNAQVGTRSPCSLPFVILPVSARSPFRFIRHWRRSTPNPVKGSLLALFSFTSSCSGYRCD